MGIAAASSATPKKWWQVYTNDRECRVFKALARGEFEWRSTSGLAKEANVKVKEVDAICAKYIPLGIIQQHSKEPDKFRYWERSNPKKASGSIADVDKKKRIDEKAGEKDCCTNSASCGGNCQNP